MPKKQGEITIHAAVASGTVNLRTGCGTMTAGLRGDGVRSIDRHLRCSSVAYRGRARNVLLRKFRALNAPD